MSDYGDETIDALRAQLAAAEQERDALRGELNRVAPFLAAHGVYGFTLVPQEPPHD